MPIAIPATGNTSSLISRIHATTHPQQLHAPERLRINFTAIVLRNTTRNFS